MKDFSIESAANRIVDARTYEYFKEVHMSYNTGSYRSAVVMLWTVVICDIVFKLEQLSTIYNDKKAKSILERIKEKREPNPNSPEWEKELVEEVTKETSLLDSTECMSLLHLQKLRHLSAHPVFTYEEALYKPTKDESRAYIRKALESILTKPALMTNKIFDALVEDLASVADTLPDTLSLKRYLEAKYFRYFSPETEKSVFRSLWHITFKVTDTLCEANRSINYRTLVVLYEKNPRALNEFIESDKDYFSELHIADNTNTTHYLLSFLSKHSTVYSLLDDRARPRIETIASSTNTNFATAWYLSSNVIEHLEKLQERIILSDAGITAQTLEEIFSAAKDTAAIPQVLEIANILYSKSSNFSAADYRFTEMIRPYLGNYEGPQLVSLLKIIETDYQLWGRRQAQNDHLLVKKRIDEVLGTNYNLSEYPNFTGSIADPPSDANYT